MSIYFTINPLTSSEAEMLESEGAPIANMSNGAGMIVAEWFTGIPADYCGTFDPEDAAELGAVLELAAERDEAEGSQWMIDANHPDGGFWHNRWERRVRDVHEVIKAAALVHRKVQWC